MNASINAPLIMTKTSRDEKKWFDMFQPKVEEYYCEKNEKIN